MIEEIKAKAVGELRKLEIIVKSGELKDCLVYHETIKDLFLKTIDKVRNETIEEVEKEIPNASECELLKYMDDNWGNNCIENIKQFLTNLKK